jgi:uncharacterized phage-associated protein
MSDHAAGSGIETNVEAGTPVSAAAVANAFLDMQDADTSAFPPIDPMKLQKLLFYAHGWWMAYNGTPLLREEVYAWPWGPVVPHIYGEFRHFGRRSIVGERATELVKTGQNILQYKIKKPDEPSPSVMAFLKAVWDSHKGLTGVQLSNATHAPGEPWAIVKMQYGELDSKPLIPNDLIRDVFKSKLAPT